MLLVLDNMFAALDNTFLRWINQKQKTCYPTGIYFIQREYMLSTANMCYPVRINVIQHENLLFNENTCL